MASLARPKPPRRPEPARPAQLVGRAHCQACNASGVPMEFMRVGPELVVNKCVEPVMCRLRAQAAGIWCTYP